MTDDPSALITSPYAAVLSVADAAERGRTDPNVAVCEPVDHLALIGDERPDEFGIGVLLAAIVAQRAPMSDAADGLDVDEAPPDDISGYGPDDGGTPPAGLTPPDPATSAVVVYNGLDEPVRALPTLTPQQWAALAGAGYPADPADPAELLAARFGGGAVLCDCLVILRAEINTRWPGRDRTSDGWIGDVAHQRSKSDHNPNGRGRVDAIDTDVDGIDPRVLVAFAIAHPSTNYVIWNRTIWSRAYGFRPRAYTGPNPHTKHVHCSCTQSAPAENSTHPWGLAVPAQRPPSPLDGITGTEKIVQQLPTLKRGSRGDHVVTLQALLVARGMLAKTGIDSDFGPKTEAAVARFQAGRNVAGSVRGNGSGDGIVGQHTWAALLLVA